MPRFLPLLRLIFIALAAPLAGAQSFEPGPRPEIPVFDPLGFLPGDTLEEISESLLRIRKADQIDIVVVVIPDFEEASPDAIARRFAEAWCDPYANGIVLYSPGRQDGPWIVPGGTLLSGFDLQKLSAEINAAQRRASREPQAPGQIRAAATETADLLRYIKGVNIQQTELLKLTWMEELRRHRAKILRYKLLGLSGAALALVLLVAAIALFLTIRRRRPRSFPNIHIQPRLGAPYCGGNSVITELGSSKS